ncbi:MAG: molybdate ABC transporter substrate-binding protein [Desulfomonilia bacterium]
MKRLVFSLAVFATLVFPSGILAQEKLTAAVAANFIQPFEELSVMFEQQTGIPVVATFTSTGKLYAQIVKGAPYDIFLAADEKRPALLFAEALSEEPFVYAQGQIVLWSANRELFTSHDWKEVVVSQDIHKIAVANTESAPYGTAAMIALQASGLWDQLQDKFVFPQTIAQVFQYASTGSVDAGFCAYSSAMSDEGKAGCWLLVKEAPDVIQAACILKQTKNQGEARKLADFLLSEQALAVKQRYGYR